MIHEHELHWLAGILEGEGYFIKGSPSKSNSPAIGIQMCDEDVVVRVASIFNVSVCQCRPRKPHHKVSFMCRVRGLTAVRWMQLLMPLMSIRRKQQIDAAIASYKKSDRYCKWTKITKANLEESKSRIAAGESLRSVARSFAVSHETLRRRLLDIPTRRLNEVHTVA